MKAHLAPQYVNRHGGWVKDRKTEVLDRDLLAKSEFRRWTGVWEPRLSGIELGEKPVTVSYELPGRLDPWTAGGLVSEPKTGVGPQTSSWRAQPRRKGCGSNPHNR